ncbi:MotE family protein [Marinicrinis lubricantis]|uniref:MotE family protein n=1 Tax=Marinicrinis lubricantis TaxID=2086470 RepID=A0ABW1IN23_9BACL
MPEHEVEKTSYGAFEKILYLFLIPVVFTSILTVVLLSMFNYDVKNSVLSFANKIPLVEKIIPDPEEEASEDTPSGEKIAAEGQSNEQLAQQIKDLQKQIDSSRGVIESKDQQILKLRAEIEQLNASLEEKRQSDEEYLNQIKKLSNMYADMTPSKSAAILERLTMDELVLVMSQMSSDDQIRILEKMNPQIAAEASIQMKDLVPAENMQIAALQSRLEIQDSEQAEDTDFTTEDLSQTFAAMTAKSSASILLEMYNADPLQVLNVLRAMNVNARSSIISSMEQQDKDKAAAISAKLSNN